MIKLQTKSLRVIRKTSLIYFTTTSRWLSRGRVRLKRNCYHPPIIYWMVSHRNLWSRKYLMTPRKMRSHFSSQSKLSSLCRTSIHSINSKFSRFWIFMMIQNLESPRSLILNLVNQRFKILNHVNRLCRENATIVMTWRIVQQQLVLKGLINQLKVDSAP